MGSSASRQKKKARKEPEPSQAAGPPADDSSPGPAAGPATQPVKATDAAGTDTPGGISSSEAPKRKSNLPPIRRSEHAGATPPPSPGDAGGAGAAHAAHVDSGKDSESPAPRPGSSTSDASAAVSESEDTITDMDSKRSSSSFQVSSANIRKALTIPTNALSRRGSASSMYTNDAEKASYFLNEIITTASAHLSEEQVIRLDWIKEGIRSHTLYEHKLNDTNKVMIFDRMTTAFIEQNLQLPKSDVHVESPVLKKVARVGSFRAKASAVKVTAHLTHMADDRHLVREALNGEDAMAALIPDGARDLLTGLDNWNFNIFAVDMATNHHPLVAVMYAAIKRLGLIEACQIDLDKLCAFCLAVEEGHLDFPYHSRLHSADVTAATFWFISTAKLNEYIGLTPRDMYAMLIAAAIHDYNHLGVSNNFLAATEHGLAIRYNNRSVLESHATASAYELINRAPTDPFSGFSKADRKASRNLIIECVMATDLCHHTDVLMNFKKFAQEHEKEGKKEVSDGLKLNAIKMTIKCADISNPARPYVIYEQWIHRIMAEFMAMGDVEKALGMPPSPFCDSDQGPDCASRCQRGFITYIVMPLFSAFKNFLPEVNLPVNIMSANFDKMSEEDDKGDKTLVVSFDKEDHGCIVPTITTLGLEHLLQDEGIN